MNTVSLVYSPPRSFDSRLSQTHSTSRSQRQVAPEVKIGTAAVGCAICRGNDQDTLLLLLLFPTQLGFTSFSECCEDPGHLHNTAQGKVTGKPLGACQDQSFSTVHIILFIVKSSVSL